MNATLTSLSEQDFNYDRAPGHWILARMGKRVLRPGGLELTQQMLTNLNIQSTDDVIEFAPGLGVTANLMLSRHPASYTAIERDETAANQVRQYLTGVNQQCVVGKAEATHLPDQSATVVYGEAMLTMQSVSSKAKIVGEAARLLKPGGRYGIHELCLQPDDISTEQKKSIERELSKSILVNARPLTVSEWSALLEVEGFAVEGVATAPMHLLKPKRFIQDEGLVRALRFVFNVIRTPQARRRILRMRAVFRQYEPLL
ncbi:MAG: class I SAM-dependent methyltransferase, partial [Chloroflexota bacterium]